MKVILFGGSGFLGQGLQEEFRNRNIDFKSIDKEDYDLINYKNLDKCIEDLKNISHVVILASKIGANLFISNPDFDLSAVIISTFLLIALSRVVTSGPSLIKTASATVCGTNIFFPCLRRFISYFIVVVCINNRIV